MARTLPWTAQAASSTPKTQAKHATAKLPKDEPKDDAFRPVTPEPTTWMAHKGYSARSPSTSPIQPPAQPIPQVSPMREGLHQDDRYIMVEDEFESLAREFTAHLHAAEYARLKRKAKEAPPKLLPDLSPSKPRTTNMKLERKHLLSRQSTMMSDLGKKARAADSDKEASDEDEAEEKVNDLWRGTSLAGLMDGAHSVKTSLMGIEKLNSKTRAAKGFGRGETESTPVKKIKTIKDIFAEVNEREDGAEQLFENRISRRDRDRDRYKDADDNRETQFHEDTETKMAKSTARKLTFDNKHPDSHGTTSKTSGLHEQSLASPNLHKSRRIFIDDFDETKFTASASTSTNTPAAKPSSRSKPTSLASVPSLIPSKRKPDIKKDRKARLDEVPVFLV